MLDAKDVNITGLAVTDIVGTAATITTIDATEGDIVNAKITAGVVTSLVGTYSTIGDVDVTYDTYTYVRKTPSSAAQKVKCGSKTCRFAQYPDGDKAVMPAVLDELLKQRKATKKLIKSSPKNLFSAVDGFLVKATPVAQSLPIFPNTID